MKPVIHIITTICRGGAENQLLTLVREQVGSGRKVSLIFLKGTPELLPALIERGVVVHSEFADLPPVIQLIRIRKFLNGVDILVHAHLPRAELIAALAKGNHSLLVTRHNAEKFFPSAPILLSSALSRYVIGRSKAVIAISQAVSKFLYDYRELPDGISPLVVHYGYRQNSEHSKGRDLRERLQIPPNAKVIGTVARLTPQKDIPTLLRAFSLVKSDIDLRLLIVGDGPLRVELIQMAVELGIQKRVVWAGRTENVFGHLCLMHVFVLTSTYEGFGLVLLEALEAKLPVVASNISAIPEVLGDDYPGLVEPGDSGEFAKKILGFLEQGSTEKVRLEKFGQDRLDFFSAVKMRGNLDEVYGA